MADKKSDPGDISVKLDDGEDLILGSGKEKRKWGRMGLLLLVLICCLVYFGYSWFAGDPALRSMIFGPSTTNNQAASLSGAGVPPRQLQAAAVAAKGGSAPGNTALASERQPSNAPSPASAVPVTERDSKKDDEFLSNREQLTLLEQQLKENKLKAEAADQEVNLVKAQILKKRFQDHPDEVVSQKGGGLNALANFRNPPGGLPSGNNMGGDGKTVFSPAPEGPGPLVKVIQDTPSGPETLVVVDERMAVAREGDKVGRYSVVKIKDNGVLFKGPGNRELFRSLAAVGSIEDGRLVSSAPRSQQKEGPGNGQGFPPNVEPPQYPSSPVSKTTDGAPSAPSATSPMD